MFISQERVTGRNYPGDRVIEIGLDWLRYAAVTWRGDEVGAGINVVDFQIGPRRGN